MIMVTPADCIYSLFYFKDQDLQYILHWKLNEDFTESLRYDCYSKHFPTYPDKSDWIMPILVCKTCSISFKTCVVTSKNVAIILKQRKPQQWLVSGPREQCSEGNRHQKLLHFSSSFDCLNICIIVYFCTCWFQLCQVRIHVSFKGTFLTLLTFTQIVVWSSKGFKFLLFCNIIEWYWRLAMSYYSRLCH